MTDQLPRVQFGSWPTPVTAAPRLAAELGLDAPLLIKRDDLTGFAVAGNKTRPLEYLIGAARAEGAELLVSGGTPASNFCQGLAAASAWAGLRVQLHYAGQPRPARHPNHLAALAWGAEICWTGDDDRSSVDAAIAAAQAQAQADGVRAMAVPRGGGTPASLAGFHHAAAELTQQVPDAALVVIALGSGGSHAGLLSGLVALGRPWQLVGASVSRPVEQARQRALELARQCAALQGTAAPEPTDVTVIDGIGPGHGVASPAGKLAARAALASNGLICDPVYTAKALAALPQIVEQWPVRSGSIVFWHTGGLLDAVGEWYGEAEG